MVQKSTYIPTRAESRLLEILLNPAYRHKNVSEVCDLARCDRKVYYRAFAKAEFAELYKSESRRLAERAIGPVINAFIKQAVAGSFNHGKVLLEMAGMISPRGYDDDDTPPPPTKVEIVVTDCSKRAS